MPARLKLTALATQSRERNKSVHMPDPKAQPHGFLEPLSDRGTGFRLRVIFRITLNGSNFRP